MKHNYLTLLLAVLMSSVSNISFAHDFEVDGIYYNKMSSSALTVAVTFRGNDIYSYINEYTGKVTIPETVTYNSKTYRVTSIGNYAFFDCKGLTSITIPSSVTSIGNSAFDACEGLTSVTIGSSVTSIGDYAFGRCSGLTSITIPNSVTSIGKDAFSDCNSLTKAEFVSVESLCKISFASNSANPLCYAHHLYINGEEIKDLIIPNGVTSISSYTFSGCSSLTSITIPNSVTSIGTGAFSGCSGLTKAEFASVESLCNISFASNAANPLYYAHHLYVDGKEVKKLVIPNSVTSINNYIFSCCSYLTSVTIPNSVTSIGNSAFSGCYFTSDSFINKSSLSDNKNWGATIVDEETIDGLLIKDNKIVRCRPWAISVNIPESVTSIVESAFSGCSGLTSVTIGNSVTSIGLGAFSGCSGLTSVTIPNSVTVIGDYAFRECSGLTSITIPNSVTSIGKQAFYGCSSLTSVAIGEGVASIGGYAFGGCSSLTSFTIPNSVTSIGNDAFFGCSGLTSVTINSNAIASKEYTTSSTLANIFGSQVKNYIFGEDVKSIGNDAFYNCSGLTSINIPNSVTSIGSSAFYGCTGLLSIVIGSGVNTIGDYAFQGCNNFDDFYCLAPNIPTLGTNVFKDSYYKYATLHVPSSSLKAYRSTAQWSEFGNIVALTEEETGLSAIDNRELKIDKVYDFSGRKQSQPQRGINIIRMKDGTTKKVLIK